MIGITTLTIGAKSLTTGETLALQCRIIIFAQSAYASVFIFMDSLATPKRLDRCPRCFRPIEQRRHNEHETAYLKRPYYFTEWDFCASCGYVQHYEEFKVHTTPESRSKITGDISFACTHGDHTSCLICQCNCHGIA